MREGSALKIEWVRDFNASVRRVWPFVSDTNRFNKIAGLPEVERVGEMDPRQLTQTLRLRVGGFTLEWQEEFFQWEKEKNFSIRRHYRGGPMLRLEVRARFEVTSVTHSRLRYDILATPRFAFLKPLIWFQLQFIEKPKFFRAFARIENAVLHAPSRVPKIQTERPRLSDDQAERARTILDRCALTPELRERFLHLVNYGDDFDLLHLRPYVLAQEWNEKRTEMLQAFIKMAAEGLMEFRWTFVCPLCQGAKGEALNLDEVNGNAHCDACQIDFTTDFERNMELTFRPSEEVRLIRVADYCLGGPEKTAHIVAQKILEPGTTESFEFVPEAGPYRLRDFRGAILEELTFPGNGRLVAFHWENPSTERRVRILEKDLRSQEKTLAVEAINEPLFRRFFSNQLLRQGLSFKVGTRTFVFTDIKGSTALYETMGDGEAFGQVLALFNLLEKEVKLAGGHVVKTMGDGAMILFDTSDAALRAMRLAQREVERHTGGQLRLRIGIHRGPALATTFSERIDYFGSTVNFVSRIEGLSSGRDIIISERVWEDELQGRKALEETFDFELFQAEVKGFEGLRNFYRMTPKP